MTQRSIHGGCPSCAIAAGISPAPVITETPAFVALLDPEPIRRGHLQIIPRAHFPCFNALPPVLAHGLLAFAENLAEAQRSAFQADRIGFLFPAAAGGHAVVHLVPLLSAGDVATRRFGATGKAVMVAASGPLDLELARSARLLRRHLPRRSHFKAAPCLARTGGAAEGSNGHHQRRAMVPDGQGG